MKRAGMAVDATSIQKNNPPEVLFISRYFYPFVGGLEKRVYNLARALTARGFRVRIVTSRISPEFPPVQTREGITVYRLACPRLKIIGACVFIAQLAWFLCARRARYQALHAFQVGHSSAAAVFMGRLLKKQVFLHLSGGGSGGDVGRHIKTPWGWVFLFLCRFASTIVVLNEQMQRELKVLMYPAARVVCIPNGVDTACYQPCKDRVQLRRAMSMPELPIILYTGRLSAEKGVATLVQAYALLRSRPVPALYILGSGPEQQRLACLIQKLRLDTTVTLLPACSDVRPWYQCADIFVMPSFHEGISNSILEAMACALPVIASDVIGNTDLVRHRHNGLLVPAGDAPALAAALDELLDNPAKAREMGCSGQHLAQTRYCFDDMVDRYCALYARR
jgi:glycosyltransferase involved in cell wall biosynthesis